MQPHLRNTPKKPTIFVTFYVKIYPILLKTTENTPPNRKISHTGKIWEKKFSEKKFIGSDTPTAKPPQRGGMALIYR